MKRPASTEATTTTRTTSTTSNERPSKRAKTTSSTKAQQPKLLPGEHCCQLLLPPGLRSPPFRFNHLYGEDDDDDQDDDDDKFQELNALERLLYPLTPEHFRTHYWRKKALVTRGGAARVSWLKKHMEQFDLAALMEVSASEDIFAWLKQPEQPQQGPAGATSTVKQVESIKVTPEAAAVLYQAGASLYFRSSQAFADMVIPSLSTPLGLNFGIRYPDNTLRGEIEIFASRKGNLTDFHHDYMDNFTVQLQGKKRWRFYSPEVVAPLRGCTPHYSSLGTEELQMKLHRVANLNASFLPSQEVLSHSTTVELEPGDMLYFPPGCWHQVLCTEDSLSMNISLMPSSWTDLAVRGVQQLMSKHAECRQGVSVLSLEQARTDASLVLSRMREVLNSLTADDLVPRALIARQLPGAPRLVDEYQRLAAIPAVDARAIKQRIRENQHFRLNSLAVLLTDDDLTSSKAVPRDAATLGLKLHWNFGGGEFESELRKELLVPRSIAAFVHTLQRNPSGPFTLASAETAHPDVPAKLLFQLFFVFVWNDYFVAATAEQQQ